MKKSLTKNYFYNLSYQILVVLTPFITIPYLARVLGPESIGLASFSSSIVSYFSLFASLGILDVVMGLGTLWTARDCLQAGRPQGPQQDVF